MPLELITLPINKLASKPRHRIHVSERDTKLIGLIIGRAVYEGIFSGEFSEKHNIIALIHSTCPLDLHQLLHSDRSTFAYDVRGMIKNAANYNNYFTRFIPECAL